MMTQKSVEQDKRNFERDYHNHHDTDPERLDRTLAATIDALVEAQIPYALIGGVAVKGLGRPRVTNDIDVFVDPDDAEKVLEVLAAKGFETEKRDPHWLFKAWREDVLVDVIFKSTGDIYFDHEMRDRVKTVNHRGRDVKTVSPEDFIVIKSAVHQEHGPHHWFDALAVLKEGGLDWDYLIRRSRHSPRKVLSLLIYAQSGDIRVPDEVIRRLFRSLYEASDISPTTAAAGREHHPVAAPGPASVKSKSAEEADLYLQARIREALAEDPRTADQDIKIIVNGPNIVARGEVFNPSQQQSITHVIEAIAPQHKLDNQVTVRELSAPERSEVVL